MFVKSTMAEQPEVDPEKHTEEPTPKHDRIVEKDEILVSWDGDNDSENPQNWSTGFKSWVTFQLSLLAFAASLASSIISPASKTIADYVEVSEDAIVLNVSLYMYDSYAGLPFGVHS